jgi:hypothetical protein
VNIGGGGTSIQTGDNGDQHSAALSTFGLIAPPRTEKESLELNEIAPFATTGPPAIERPLEFAIASRPRERVREPLFFGADVFMEGGNSLPCASPGR